MMAPGTEKICNAAWKNGNRPNKKLVFSTTRSTPTKNQIWKARLAISQSASVAGERTVGDALPDRTRLLAVMTGGKVSFGVKARIERIESGGAALERSTVREYA